MLELYRSAYRGISREIWILALVLFVNRCGSMVLPFLVVYLTTQRGLDEATAGLALTAWGVGSFGGIALGGWLTDRVGYRAVQCGSLALSGIGYPLFAAIPEGGALLLASFALGAVAECFRPANQTAVAAFAPPERRAQAFGLTRLGINLGWSVGPALGGLFAEHDFRWLFWFDGATCLVAAVCVFLFLPAVGTAKRPTNDEADSLEKGASCGSGPWRDRAFLVVFAMTALQALVFFQVQSTYPLDLHEGRGLSLSTVGLLLAGNGVLIVLFEMPLIHAVRGRPPLLLAAIASACVGLGFGLTALAEGVACLALLVALWTLGEMLAAPTVSAWVADRATDERRGAYMAAYAMAFSLCFAVAPLVGTWLYQRSPDGLWAACAASGLASALGFYLLSKSQERAKGAEAA